MDVVDIISKILLIILIIIQIIVMIYVFYINRKRFQEDKKFWAEQEIITNDFLRRIEIDRNTHSIKITEEKKNDESND